MQKTRRSVQCCCILQCGIEWQRRGNCGFVHWAWRWPSMLCHCHCHLVRVSSSLQYLHPYFTRPPFIIRPSAIVYCVICYEPPTRNAPIAAKRGGCQSNWSSQRRLFLSPNDVGFLCRSLCTWHIGRLRQRPVKIPAQLVYFDHAFKRYSQKKKYIKRKPSFAMVCGDTPADDPNV